MMSLIIRFKKLNNMISQEERVQRLGKSLVMVPDYPKPGINFCDILPIFADPELLHLAVDAFEHILKGV